ncbi:putative membrane protein [Alteromonadaceae bacterium 2753L.S.0a.02]|nr:putative membrane protein [Alteromonadaceae bacterium 2753L.S.0a.02]
MIKSMTFAAMHFSIAFAVAWALTGDWAVGGAVALVEPAINSVAYIFHERIWAGYKKSGRLSWKAGVAAA